MVSIWGTFWLLQHLMIARPGGNLATLCISSSYINGATAIACKSTRNGFTSKRMRPYCKLETEQERCIIVRQFLCIFKASKYAIFQTYSTRNCALGHFISKCVCSPQISQSVQKI